MNYLGIGRMVGLQTCVLTRSRNSSRRSLESVGNRGRSRGRGSASERGRGYMVVGLNGREDGGGGGDGRDLCRRDRGMDVRVHGLGLKR